MFSLKKNVGLLKAVPHTRFYLLPTIHPMSRIMGFFDRLKKPFEPHITDEDSDPAAVPETNLA